MSLLTRHQDLTTVLVIGVLLAFLPALVANNYQLSILVFIGLNTMLTIGLSLLMGYAGQISLGHGVFFGLGAYATGILTTRLGWSPWLAMVVALALTAVIAYLIGIPIFRLRGHYLAMATLGLNIIFELILISETDLTGGPNGLTNVPKLAVGDFVLKGDLTFYYLVWAVTLVILGLSLNIVNSRVGRAWRAIHTSELAAETVGIDTAKFKLQVLVLSAVYASVAGSLYVFYLSIISPSVVNIFFSIGLVVMVAIGGLASVWGAIFGAATITLLTEGLRNVIPMLFRGATAEFEIVTYGLILMIVMIFMPEGLTTGTVNLYRKWRHSQEGD